MKLRIYGNSIRFRLTQPEVSSLAAGEGVESSVQFTCADEDRLNYAVEISSEISEVLVSHSGGTILVTLPKEAADLWASSNRIGIEHVHPIGNGAFLKIAVEKDFRCLHPRPQENEADNFPNPRNRTNR